MRLCIALVICIGLLLGTWIIVCIHSENHGSKRVNLNSQNMTDKNQIQELDVKNTQSEIEWGQSDSQSVTARQEAPKAEIPEVEASHKTENYDNTQPFEKDETYRGNKSFEEDKISEKMEEQHTQEQEAVDSRPNTETGWGTIH